MQNNRPSANATPAFSRPTTRPAGGGFQSGAIPGATLGNRTRPSTLPATGTKPPWQQPGGIANRPGAGGGGTQVQPPRSNIANRPGGNTNINNRPISNRPININNGNINTGNIGVNNRPINGGQNWNQHYNNWHGNNWGYGSWHYGSYWPVPSYPGAAAAGAALGWAAGSAGNYGYSNPYAGDGGGGGDTTVYNYSEPIAAPATAASADATAAAPAAPPAGGAPAGGANPGVNPQAQQAFDSARATFKAGDYAGAQRQVEAAIKLMPDDAVLHEFRALCLFAQQKYDDAAGVLYAVLAAGPPWDWDTLQALYPSADVYTQQLRMLEQYVQQNPNSTAGHFVLAYQYMCTGDGDAAKQQLQVVAQQQPKDQLSAALLKSMQAAPAGAAA
jgi:hypothetical protein